MHLVIGARGFAGRHAVAALGGPGRVRCAEPADDLRAAMADVEVVHVTAELRSPFERQHAGHRPAPHPLLVQVVRAAREAGVRRVVLLSSASARGFTRAHEVSERTRPHPEHPYERLLAADEAWLRSQVEPESVVLQAAQPLGPGEPLLSRLLHRLAAGGLSLPGGGRGRRTFLAGTDLGSAVRAAGLRGQPGARYLVGGFTGCWRDLLTAAAGALGLDVRPGSLSYDLAYLGAASRLLRTRTGRECWPTPFLVDLLARPQLVESGWSRRELSWKPEVTAYAEGLAGLADWFTSPAAEPHEEAVGPRPGSSAVT